MSLTIQNQYYLDNYGASTTSGLSETPGSYEDSLEASDSDQASFYSEQGAPAVNTSRLEEISYRLQELDAKIDSDPTLSALRIDMSLVQDKVDDAKRPGVSAAQFDILMNAADALLTEIDAHMANQAPVHDAEDRIKSLEGAIRNFQFPADQEGTKEELERKLGQAKAKVDLEADGGDWKEINTLLGQVENQFEKAQKQIEGGRKKDLAKFDEQKKTFLAKIESSEHLRDAEKEDLKTRFESLATENREALEDGEITVDEAIKSWDKLDFEAGATEREGRLKRNLETLTTKTPSSGHNWELTKQVASLVSQAIRTGKASDWASVKARLMILQLTAPSAANDVVMALTGTLFYRFAGKNQEKFYEYLDLIPADVRHSMQDAVLADAGERNDFQGYFNESEREMDCVYGTPIECDEAISNSLLYSRDEERSRVRLGEKEAAK
ncbi:MAG TPA: hypothetical protein VJP40_09840 [bacterium]|nr:hypothetical protein [bacterium]